MTSSKNCWSCDKKIGYKDFVCNACGVLQKPFELNPFDIFSIDKKFEIDTKILEEKYLELQILLHPDKFINASQEEKTSQIFILPLLIMLLRFCVMMLVELKFY